MGMGNWATIKRQALPRYKAGMALVRLLKGCFTFTCPRLTGPVIVAIIGLMGGGY